MECPEIAVVVFGCCCVRDSRGECAAWFRGVELNRDYRWGCCVDKGVCVVGRVGDGVFGVLVCWRCGKEL